jgi:hypothetical protein
MKHICEEYKSLQMRLVLNRGWPLAQRLAKDHIRNLRLQSVRVGSSLEVGLLIGKENGDVYVSTSGSIQRYDLASGCHLPTTIIHHCCDGITTLYTKRYTRSAFLYPYNCTAVTPVSICGWILEELLRTPLSPQALALIQYLYLCWQMENIDMSTWIACVILRSNEAGLLLALQAVHPVLPLHQPHVHGVGRIKNVTLNYPDGRHDPTERISEEDMISGDKSGAIDAPRPTNTPSLMSAATLSNATNPTIPAGDMTSVVTVRVSLALS